MSFIGQLIYRPVQSRATRCRRSIGCVMFIRALPLIAALLWPGVPAEAARNVTLTRGEFSVEFRDPSNASSDELARHMINLFFLVYPKLVSDFNCAAPRQVVFVIANDDKGVAEADGNRITYHMGWFGKNPRDVDAVTHELMHVVQSYGEKPVPSWLTEGIADYARNKYGIANEAAGWSLGAPAQGASYKDGYRVTGAFLAWLESTRHPGIVGELDRQAREGTYNDAIWGQLTGSRVDDLWGAFKEEFEVSISKRTDAVPWADMPAEKRAEIAELMAKIISDARERDEARARLLDQPIE